jgi:hypothetical protein
MNDMTIAVIKDVWKAKRRSVTSFEAFAREVSQEYQIVFAAEVLTPMVARALRLASVFSPVCFDHRDLCESCEFSLTQEVCNNFANWWLDRHPEWELSPFTELDLVVLGISFGQPIQIAFGLAF